MNYSLKVILVAGLAFSSQNALSMDGGALVPAGGAAAGAGIAALGVAAFHWFGGTTAPTKPFDIRDHIEGLDKFGDADIKRTQEFWLACHCSDQPTTDMWFDLPTEEKARNALSTSASECVMYGKAKCVNDNGKACLDTQQLCKQNKQEPFRFTLPSGEVIEFFDENDPRAREVFSRDDLTRLIELQKACLAGHEGSPGAFQFETEKEALRALAKREPQCALYGKAECVTDAEGHPQTKICGFYCKPTKQQTVLWAAIFNGLVSNGNGEINMKPTSNFNLELANLKAESRNQQKQQQKAQRPAKERRSNTNRRGRVSNR